MHTILLHQAPGLDEGARGGLVGTAEDESHGMAGHTRPGDTVGRM